MVLSITDIQLFQFLKEKVGEKEAEALVSFVDSKIKDSYEQSSKITATKEEVANLRTELKEEVVNLRVEMANLRTELKTDIAQSKAEVIKWMFIFWIGQLAASLAIAKFFINK